MKKLIKDIANNKTTKDDAVNSLKEESGYIEEIKSLERKGNRPTIISTYTNFVKPFRPDYFDKTDNKIDDEADNEQLDTTDMPDLESEESASQNRKRRTRIKNVNSTTNAYYITNFFSSIRSRK